MSTPPHSFDSDLNPSRLHKIEKKKKKEKLIYMCSYTYFIFNTLFRAAIDTPSPRQSAVSSRALTCVREANDQLALVLCLDSSDSPLN